MTFARTGGMRSPMHFSMLCKLIHFNAITKSAAGAVSPGRLGEQLSASRPETLVFLEAAPAAKLSADHGNLSSLVPQFLSTRESCDQIKSAGIALPARRVFKLRSSRPKHRKKQFCTGISMVEVHFSELARIYWSHSCTSVAGLRKEMVSQGHTSPDLVLRFETFQFRILVNPRRSPFLAMSPQAGSPH